MWVYQYFFCYPDPDQRSLKWIRINVSWSGSGSETLLLKLLELSENPQLHKGSRKNKKRVFLKGSTIKALPPSPFELNGSWNLFLWIKKKFKNKYFVLNAKPFTPLPPS